MSTSAPWTLKQMCRCGHHKDTHFEGKGACLGMRCDDCAKYRDASKPEVKEEPKPVAKWEEEAPDTDPSPWWGDSWTFT